MAIEINKDDEWKNENIYSFNGSPEGNHYKNKIVTHKTYEMNLQPLKIHNNAQPYKNVESAK